MIFMYMHVYSQFLIQRQVLIYLNKIEPYYAQLSVLRSWSSVESKLVSNVSGTLPAGRFQIYLTPVLITKWLLLLFSTHGLPIEFCHN